MGLEWDEMSEIKDGGPAFPRSGIFPRVLPQEGFTKREWFAGMAVQGMLANFYQEGFPRQQAEDYAKSAFHVADAMLKEGKQP